MVCLIRFACGNQCAGNLFFNNKLFILRMFVELNVREPVFVKQCSGVCFSETGVPHVVCCKLKIVHLFSENKCPAHWLQQTNHMRHNICTCVIVEHVVARSTLRGWAQMKNLQTRHSGKPEVTFSSRWSCFVQTPIAQVCLTFWHYNWHNRSEFGIEILKERFHVAKQHILFLHVSNLSHEQVYAVAVWGFLS